MIISQRRAQDALLVMGQPSRERVIIHVRVPIVERENHRPDSQEWLDGGGG